MKYAKQLLTEMCILAVLNVTVTGAIESWSK